MTAVLPRGRGVRRYGLAGLLNATGTGVFYPYALIVLPELTGLRLSLVGLLLTATALVVLPLLTPVGQAADRWGAREVLVVACALRVLAYLGYAFGPGLTSFVLCSLVIALANRAEQISTPVLAATLAPDGEAGRWLALSRAVFNAGVGAGAVAGGLVITHGRDGAVLVSVANAVSFAAAAALVMSLPHGRAGAAPARPGARPTVPWRDPPFRRASLAVAALWFAALAVEAALPLVVIEQLGQPAWLVGLLFAVNTVLLAVLQLPVSAWTDRRDDWTVLGAGAALCLALPAGQALLGLGQAGLLVAAALLVPAMIVHSAGEMAAGQAGAVLLTRLPPPHRRGGYLAYHQKLIGVGSAAAPAAVTGALAAGRGVLWGGLGVVVLAAAALALTGRITSNEEVSDGHQ